ncbi:hypothetical protein A2U01_0056283, partial [Trifolium medium]|nr:hypothetical protein [Trifolium medium]
MNQEAGPNSMLTQAARNIESQGVNEQGDH